MNCKKYAKNIKKCLLFCFGSYIFRSIADEARLFEKANKNIAEKRFH